MTTQTDIGHGRGWLAPDPAASIRRIDRQLGHPLQITWAGRSAAEQQELIDKWLAGEGAYAAPIDESPHPMGIAIDSDEAQRHLELMYENGWGRPLKSEPWHFVYRASRDQRRNDPAPAGESENDMTPEERQKLNEVHSMLLEVRGALGAAGGHNMPTKDTFGHKINEIRDYLGAGGGKGTKSPDTIGHKISVIFNKLTGTGTDA